LSLCKDRNFQFDSKHFSSSISYLIGEKRKVLSIASQAGDEVTVSMMSDYLKEQD
jgi:DNA-binding ferritin-like protein